MITAAPEDTIEVISLFRWRALLRDDDQMNIRCSVAGGRGDFSYNRRGPDSYDGNDRGDRDARSGGNVSYRNNYRDQRDNRDSRGDGGRNGFRNGWGNDRNRGAPQAASSAPRNTRWQMDDRHPENEWIVRTNLPHAQEVIADFHRRHPNAPRPLNSLGISYGTFLHSTLTDDIAFREKARLREGVMSRLAVLSERFALLLHSDQRPVASC